MFISKSQLYVVIIVIIIKYLTKITKQHNNNNNNNNNNNAVSHFTSELLCSLLHLKNCFVVNQLIAHHRMKS
jgi:hypothetical protein